MMRVSVVVSTYNRPLALARVLESLAAQTELPTEVIVADDGSGPQTTELICGLGSQYPVPLIHAWQEDDGFRLARARNLAVARASGDWLHFLDGDCVAQVTLIERIRKLAGPGWMLAGDRILLSESLTAEVEAEALPIHRWTHAQWRARCQAGEINRMLPLRYWPFRLGRDTRPRDWRQFRGANIGLMRADYVRLNGFEAQIQGWGLEDSEFAVRAINFGLKIRSGRLALGVFHLWHEERSRESGQRNQQILEAAIRDRRTRAHVGLAEVRE